MAGTFVLGDTIIREVTIFDQGDPPLPLTGVTSPAGVDLDLFRQSGSAMIAASETVTWTEIGATGRYYFRFTPENIGLYTLEMMALHASANRSGVSFEFSVLSAGSVFSPAYANCFCAETDIERRIQQTISATSTPSDTAATAFAEERAAVLMSLCARLGFTVTPTTITAGSRLEDLLRAANAIGAAKDFLLAQQTGIAGELPDSIAAWDDEWMRYVSMDQKAPGHIWQEVRGNLVSLSTDHIQSGDTLAPASTAAPTSEAFGGPIGMGSLF